MALHKIKKGLALPIAGAPEQTVSDASPPKRVAIVAEDYVGMKPTMRVKVGDAVARGQVLFEDKKTPGVRYTAPGAGTVVAVNRGARRALQTVVVELNDRERANNLTADDEVTYKSYTGKAVAGLSREEIQALLIESGLWTALRGRPYSKVAYPGTTPRAVFVTATDTNPLAPSADVVYRGHEEAFAQGLICAARLTEGKTYLCKAAGSAIDAPTYSGIAVEEFEGIHPAGTVGVHINYLDPADRERTVWHLGYQDVIAMGTLFTTGKMDWTRVISLAGPAVERPRLLRTRIGAALDDLVAGELKDGDNRVISGSVFNGRAAMGDVLGYLGRYHNQVTVLAEGRERVLLGWLRPGFDKFSVVNAFASRLNRKREYDFTTTLHGGGRAMVPIGVYERVMPLKNIVPTFLLRSLVAGDTERAEELGCLELDEEDLALCTFVSPSKIDYGPILRRNLTEIEKEG